MRVTKATLTQECEHLRRMLALEVQTTSMLRGEIEKLKAQRVARAPSSARPPRRTTVSEIGRAAAEYCQIHGVKSASKDVLMESLRA